MRINVKQQELIGNILDDLKKHFPEVRFVDITESPENPNDLWINVTEPEDEDKEIELRKFFSEKCTDILMDYGYHILVMPIR
ncbi:MAG: hypothetical protein BWK80_32035 [Desulfobacteraceae bacterium IS3]|nr:MAG: hypothetical protein BWK80_32035 [Desulfobacteraceae bacterium IS3]